MISFFFLNPTDEIEEKSIVRSLKPLKAIGPNGIQKKLFGFS